MAFKENLIRYRIESGLNAKEFAKKLGISYTTYLTYEKGTWPNEEKLIRIAAALNVSVDQLLSYAVVSVEQQAALASHAGLAVKRKNGLYAVEVPPGLKVDDFEKAYIKGCNLAPLPASDFNKAVKLARQHVIDENNNRFILWILKMIDHIHYLNRPPHIPAAELERAQKKPPAE